MAKTINGRPARLGSVYFKEFNAKGHRRLVYCAGYCPCCGEKIGLTSEELGELYLGMPNALQRFWYRFKNIKIVF